MENLNKKFQEGDIVFVKGYSPLSLLIRLLTSIRYSISFKNCFSHICFFIDSNNIISAEVNGVQILSYDKIFKNAFIEVYRFVNPPENISKIAEKFILGKKYAFARYILDAMYIFGFCFLFVFLLLFPFSKINIIKNIFLFCGIFGILMFPLRLFFKKSDKKRYDCAESVAYVYLLANRYIPFENIRSEFPNLFYQIILNLEKWGIVKKIYLKYK